MSVALLAELEARLRARGFWQAEPPPPEALASRAPFCADTLTFSAWLQWVYLPRARDYYQRHRALPAPCLLTPIAEEAWRGCAEVEPLLRLLTQLERP